MVCLFHTCSKQESENKVYRCQMTWVLGSNSGGLTSVGERKETQRSKSDYYYYRVHVTTLTGAAFETMLSVILWTKRKLSHALTSVSIEKLRQ